ncbi:MAG: hypothetical protein HY900_10490 [Deltaproteobacteria bacterium]|nr:hypothetical protein [Deltaproteobacteria bacterium]
MRVAALQKEIKADLRDLGNLVYNAILNHQTAILEEEEVKILVHNIRNNKAEVERLRDSISRLGRAKKHFTDEETEPHREGPRPDEEPAVVVEPAPSPSEPAADVTVSEQRELEGAMLQSPQPTEEKPSSKRSKAADSAPETEGPEGSAE